MNPKYPVFIPTYNRYELRHTIKEFERIGVPFHAVVQPQEYDQYAAAIQDTSMIITLPSDVKGLVPTRNWIWDYAQSLRVSYFWTFDDNIRCFYRLHQNKRIRFDTGTFLTVIEDWAERYSNVAITGMQYRMFAASTQGWKPVNLNTRVYSNMLIKTDIPYCNRGVYNDDTDLCLRVLKDGWCTALFYAFLADKLRTMTVKGGNTDELYQGDGRLKMAQSLQAQHPDVVKIAWKWGRWQHQVDYRPFKNNRPMLRPGVVIPDEPNNYGMKLVRRSPESKTQSSEDQSSS